jgi:hypothetical protein
MTGLTNCAMIGYVNAYIRDCTGNSKKYIKKYKKGISVTKVYSMTHDMIQHNAQDIVEYSDKEKELLGTEIVAGKVNYGFIVSFKYTYTGYETITSAITDKDYEFDMAQLLSFIRQIELRNANIAIVYPDGSDYSKRKFGSQRKARTSAITGNSQIHPSHYLK